MKNRNEVLDELQKVISYTFKNLKLLDTALTHSSFVNQKKNVEYNERLEFLGDSVLQLCISEYLFNNFKDKSEGELTKTRSIIVCENSLYEIAKGWELGKYINMSKGEELTGGRTRVSIMADAVEALIAAIYIDTGIEKANSFILTNFENTIKLAIEHKIILDYKTQLQEFLQKNGDVSIIYNMSGYDGPPHRRKFFMEVVINGVTRGKGEGFSKKEAEQSAAKNVLKSIGGNK